MNETTPPKPTALVTGASMGIGLELARRAAGDGHDVILVARSGDKLDDLARELAARHGARATVIAEDLADRGAPARIEARVRDAGLRVDVLVNCAGFGSNGSYWTNDRDRELDMIQVNVTTLADLTHRFVTDMVERRRGRILNVASTAGFVPGPKMAVYYASKAFVVSFTEALAHELRGTGVTATALCPGPVATAFSQVAGNAHSILFRVGVAKPERVAAAGWRAMQRGRALCVTGWTNQLAIQGMRFSPRFVARAVAGLLNS
ncbi:MAG: SDR family oxidoreductase [bacterium]